MKSPLQRGFSLIEMLVTISIVSFMLLMMMQITGLAEKAWHVEQDRIDNFGKARAMVDMFTDDLQRAVYRGDLPIFVQGAPATPTLTSNGLFYFPASTSTTTPTSTLTFTAAFYTRLPGVPSLPGTSVRDISLVSYALNSSGQGSDKIVLQRSDLAVPWTSSQNILFQGNIATVLSTSTATAREVAPGVVGFRLAFRLADGTVIDQSQYKGYNPANPTVAIDVGVAVVGKQSLAILSAQNISDLQSNLFNAPITYTGIAPPGSVKTYWDSKLNASFLTNYPKDMGSGLKTFERWVACPSF